MVDAEILLAVQGLATALIAAWLTLGVRDNILYPSANETYTAEVMSMVRMKEEFPGEYAHVAHRAITDRRVQLFAFRLVVVAELVATVLLWIGVIAVLMAFVGTGSVETAKTLCLIGAIAFTAVWGGFLVVGNHFCYWFCHEGAQNTHYQMTLWGLATTILIAL